MVLPLRRPDVFGCLATHSGDALFEMCFIPGFPQVIRGCGNSTATSTPTGRTSTSGLPHPAR